MSTKFLTCGKVEKASTVQCHNMLANLGPRNPPETLCHQTANPTRTKPKGICAHLRPPQLEAMSAEEKDGDSSVSPTDLMRDAIQKGREEIEKHGEVVRDAIQKGREEIEKQGEVVREAIQKGREKIEEHGEEAWQG